MICYDFTVRIFRKKNKKQSFPSLWFFLPFLTIMKFVEDHRVMAITNRKQDMSWEYGGWVVNWSPLTMLISNRKQDMS